jgi:hypothetical protein
MSRRGRFLGEPLPEPTHRTAHQALEMLAPTHDGAPGGAQHVAPQDHETGLPSVLDRRRLPRRPSGAPKTEGDFWVFAEMDHLIRVGDRSAAPAFRSVCLGISNSGLRRHEDILRLRLLGRR